MNVNEAIEILQAIARDGKGGWPLQVMRVKEKGRTYAYDIEIDVAREYDGDLVWVHMTEEYPPGWL